MNKPYRLDWSNILEIVFRITFSYLIRVLTPLLTIVQYSTVQCSATLRNLPLCSISSFISSNDASISFTWIKNLICYSFRMFFDWHGKYFRSEGSKGSVRHSFWCDYPNYRWHLSPFGHSTVCQVYCHIYITNTAAFWAGWLFRHQCTAYYHS